MTLIGTIGNIVIFGDGQWCGEPSRGFARMKSLSSGKNIKKSEKPIDSEKRVL
jgi:hypothetical protein